MRDRMRWRIALKAQGDEHMSHVIEIPDDVYDAIRHYADETGESVEALIGSWAHGLDERLRRAKTRREHPLDWQTATPEEIIADLKASRNERDCDTDR